MNDIVLDKRGGYNRTAINHVFFKQWSPPMAYVLGYAFADGSLIDSKPSRTCYLRFYSVDEEHLRNISKLLDRDGRIFCRGPQVIRKESKIYKSKPCYYISIGSRRFFSDLLKLGLTPNKSCNMLFPSIPNEFLGFFVRGFFDGDGCSYVSGGSFQLRYSTQEAVRILDFLYQDLEKAPYLGRKFHIYSQWRGTQMA